MGREFSLRGSVSTHAKFKCWQHCPLNRLKISLMLRHIKVYFGFWKQEIKCIKCFVNGFSNISGKVQW